MKNRLVAGLLAILLGGIGIHHFYLGRMGYGILSIVFCWTGIPGIIGLVEGIIMLTQTDQEFQQKYNLESVESTAGAFGGTSVSKADELRKYRDLYDDGAITLEEYEQKKKDLL